MQSALKGHMMLTGYVTMMLDGKGRQINFRFIKNFLLSRYPFDTQRCKMIFVPTEVKEPLVCP